jgi:hypothetical protein
MTMPFERTWAVLNTREFLLNLLDPKKTPRVPKDIRFIAKCLLKHYPDNFSFDEMFDKNSYEKVFGKLDKERRG